MQMGWGGVVLSQFVNHLQYDMPPLGPQANWQSQISKPFHKTQRVDADLTLRGIMFQKSGTMSEKILLLVPATRIP